MISGMHALPCLLATILCLTTACQQPPQPEAALAAARQHNPRARAWLMHGPGGAIGYRLALGWDSVPAVVRRNSEIFVQPGGELLLLAAEEGPAGKGFRIHKSFGPGQERSLLLDRDGRVLERSHQIDTAEVPETVLRRLRLENPGALLRAASLQGPPGSGARFLMEVATPDGPKTLRCTALGEVQSSYRWEPE